MRGHERFKDGAWRLVVDAGKDLITGKRRQVNRTGANAASRFWTFEWVETGIFTALALGLAGFCFWRLRRPLS
jgi:hypothetical protein